MAYEGTISKGCEMELRSVYCSESVKVKRLVAYCVDADQDDKGTGSGFGFIAQYPTASTSLVCGSVYDPGGGVTGYDTGDVCAVIRRGYVDNFQTYRTSTVSEVFSCHTSLGIGVGNGIGPVADWTPGVCGVHLETDAGTATTTAAAFVNCWA